MKTAAIFVLLAAACVATTNAGARHRQAFLHTKHYTRISTDLGLPACELFARQARNTGHHPCHDNVDIGNLPSSGTKGP